MLCDTQPNNQRTLNLYAQTEDNDEVQVLSDATFAHPTVPSRSLISTEMPVVSLSKPPQSKLRNPFLLRREGIPFFSAEERDRLAPQKEGAPSFRGRNAFLPSAERRDAFLPR